MMNQKVLVTLATSAIILGVVNLTLLLIPNLQNFTSPSQSTLPNTGQKIPLKFTMTINNNTEYYPVQMTVYLPDEAQTLFNCHIKIDYLTQSNSWKTASKSIGLVNYGEYSQQSLTLDADFDSGEVPISPDNYYQSVPDPSLINTNVEVYGYLKP